jgi:RHS repeat-associated protein
VTTATAVITYDYDCLSRRIGKTVDPTTGDPVTTRYLYDGWNLIAEYSGQTLAKTYLWGMDLSGSMQGAGGVGGLLAVSDGATTCYPTFDGNGNVSEYLVYVADAEPETEGEQPAAGAVAHFEYDAFGNIVADSYSPGFDASSFAHKFSTKYHDSETGFYYYGYRWYDPLTGRWPSRDPIGEIGFKSLRRGIDRSLSLRKLTSQNSIYITAIP